MPAAAATRAPETSDATAWLPLAAEPTAIDLRVAAYPDGRVGRPVAVAVDRVTHARQ